MHWLWRQFFESGRFHPSAFAEFFHRAQRRLFPGDNRLFNLRNQALEELDDIVEDLQQGLDELTAENLAANAAYQLDDFGNEASRCPANFGYAFKDGPPNPGDECGPLLDEVTDGVARHQQDDVEDQSADDLADVLTQLTKGLFQEAEDFIYRFVSEVIGFSQCTFKDRVQHSLQPLEGLVRIL